MEVDTQAIPKALAPLSQRKSSSLSGVEGTANVADRSVSEAELSRSGVTERSRSELQKLETELLDRDEKLTTLLADKNSIDQELKQLLAELATVKQANTAQPDTHDYSEAQTRDLFIDLLLKEAGWDMASAPLSKRKKSSSLNESSSLSEVEGTTNVAREFEVTGMPNQSAKGYVDYVFWGDDGKPLAIVEAKRTKRDSREGQQQAKLYADCLETRFNINYPHYKGEFARVITHKTPYAQSLIDDFSNKDKAPISPFP